MLKQGGGGKGREKSGEGGGENRKTEGRREGTRQTAGNRLLVDAMRRGGAGHASGKSTKASPDVCAE